MELYIDYLSAYTASRSDLSRLPQFDEDHTPFWRSQRFFAHGTGFGFWSHTIVSCSDRNAVYYYFAINVTYAFLRKLKLDHPLGLLSQLLG